MKKRNSFASVTTWQSSNIGCFFGAKFYKLLIAPGRVISKKQSQKKSGGKLLYAFFLDRVSLSIKNGWIDDQGRVFIYYSIKNICEDLNCGTQKACKLLDELEKVGVLERKRQGLGRPNKLYLKKMF